MTTSTVRLNEKTTEKEDAENHDDRDDDDLDQTHGLILGFLGQERNYLGEASRNSRLACFALSKAHLLAIRSGYEVSSHKLRLKEPQRIRHAQSAAHFGGKRFDKRQMITVKRVAHVEEVKRDDMRPVLAGD